MTLLLGCKKDDKPEIKIPTQEEIEARNEAEREAAEQEAARIAYNKRAK